MKTFKDFGIKAETQSFTGDKVKIKKIINKEITVHHYKVTDSKHFENKKCLHLQIELDGEKKVIFTSSNTLLSMIQSVPKDSGFPFKTIIIEDEERYLFS
ncbi:MAG: hypothetical protein UZ05_CHB002002199 [Chlorobi bacterium OLB5]|nr:MAG: hypothetical protein UZ05_CHB002002199 [Chlorobi bacterium OLB5]